MTQILYGVFQGWVGGDELQGVVTKPELAIAWVEKLIEFYGLTHFDTPVEVFKDPSAYRSWEGIHATWAIREIPILEELPLLEPGPWETTVHRLLQKADPTLDLSRLPQDLKRLAQLEIDTCGRDQVVMGHDEKLGWFVLHRDEDLVYVIEVEKEGVEAS